MKEKQSEVDEKDAGGKMFPRGRILKKSRYMIFPFFIKLFLALFLSGIIPKKIKQFLSF